jgi:transposase-like protein
VTISWKLKRLQSRERYVALFLDGKSFADATLVIALGVTADGSKRFLGLRRDRHRE